MIYHQFSEPVPSLVTFYESRIPRFWASETWEKSASKTTTVIFRSKSTLGWTISAIAISAGAEGFSVMSASTAARCRWRWLKTKPSSFRYFPSKRTSYSAASVTPAITRSALSCTPPKRTDFAPSVTGSSWGKRPRNMSKLTAQWIMRTICNANLYFWYSIT